ncbi:MAG: 4-hydroxy-tetrahydrodipicolinate reductase [Candidatus Aureabacteria bacterium]|nr:4-hydroxy-tetrahydrodipicolinate reductase [Candidatus Auribacterota bacterium]
MINIAVSGAAGRMGKRIINVILSHTETKLVGACEAKGHGMVGRDAGEVAGAGPAEIQIVDSISEILENADVLIDFSAKEASMNNIQEASENKVAVIVGTTGLTDDDLEKLSIYAKVIPLLISANMSVGINLLLQFVGKVGVLLGKDYDIEIIETHHKFKKDAPSGTAKSLANTIKDSLREESNRKTNFVYGREGMVGEKPENEIGVHAVRTGDVIGEHTVVYSGAGERIEITHKAHTRDTFARGAVRAAIWIKDKPAGAYTMKDVLFG